MTRTMLVAALFSLTFAGCAAVNPATPPAASGHFDAKLLNLFSLGSQSAGQVNYVPNSQQNLSGQAITSNTTAMFPIASLVGTGGAFATNVTGQAITNGVAQTQIQSQLVL